MDTREELRAVLDELDSDELPAPEVLRFALQPEQQEILSALRRLAEALTKLPALPLVVHRDLKPENVIPPKMLPHGQVLDYSIVDLAVVHKIEGLAPTTLFATRGRDSSSCIGLCTGPTCGRS